MGLHGGDCSSCCMQKSVTMHLHGSLGGKVGGLHSYIRDAYVTLCGNVAAWAAMSSGLCFDRG